jgi:LysR family transcriptional regulator, transcription activator of glutamate synthase operon
MEIKQAQYFLKLAETSNYSMAAEELYISQSSLSKQILALEKELGFALIDRSKRKISLSPAGAAFLQHAQQIVRDYQSMLADTAQYRTTPSFSIVAIPVIAQYGITAYIAQFQSTHPNLQLALEEREASSILPALDNHQFDLAFLRDNYLDPQRYSVLEVARDQFVVVLSAKHRLAARTSLALIELADENFIMFDKGTVVHELAVEACRSAGFEPRIFYASLRVESILGLVASNSGIALMMEKIYAYHKPSELIAIPLAEKVESKILLARVKEKMLPKPAATFWDFMKKAVEER